jgi:hypothetical protein
MKKDNKNLCNTFYSDNCETVEQQTRKNSNFPIRGIFKPVLMARMHVENHRSWANIVTYGMS